MQALPFVGKQDSDLSCWGLSEYEECERICERNALHLLNLEEKKMKPIPDEALALGSGVSAGYE